MEGLASCCNKLIMDPASMQMQIKNNASDLQDYLRGLEDWETDVKAKDAALSNHKSILKEKLPPIRGGSRKKETKKKKSKPVKSSSQDKPRIKSYDFKAWDKFDVDQACEEVDYQVESTSSSEGEEEIEQEAQRKQQAVYEKEKGNELFKKGQYEQAVECYTKAAELDPLNPVMVANRAMTLLKLERYASAETDCSLALTMDDCYLKAFLRRGTARLHLGKPEKAREDFQAALKLEPGNKLAKAELEKLNKEREKKCVRPVKRPPHLRSKKPLKRIPIEDIGEDPSEQTPPNSQQSTTPPISTPHSVTTPTNQPHSSPNNSPEAETTNPIQTSQSGQTSQVATSVAQESTKITESGAHTIVTETPHANTSSKIQVLSAQPEPAANSPKSSSKIKVVATDPQPPDSEAGSRLEVVGVVKLPSVPENSITLQADWKRVRRDRRLLGEYFKNLPTSKYPTLLRQSLETDIFSDILTILLEDYVRCGTACLAELQALTRVNRFSVALMFLSSADKQNLKLLFSDLKQLVSGDKDGELLRTLSSTFGL